MGSYDGQLEAVTQATVIHSATIYSWFGKRSPDLPPAVKRALTPEIARSYLSFILQQRFYNDFYCKGLAVATEREVVRPPSWGMTSFVQELSGANSGEGYWAEGWTVRSMEDDELVLHRDGLEVRARAEDCRLPPGISIAPGVPLSPRFPKEFLGLSPGFYVALGNVEFSKKETSALVRFYWNITAHGAVCLMRSTTSMLNRAGIPFQLKVLNNPDRFLRCDAAVLYIHKSNYEAVAEILEQVYPTLAHQLKYRTPSLTKRLAAGLGLAEDPGQGVSFGLHRCGIVAEGIVRAYEKGQQSDEDRLSVVSDCLTQAGIRLKQPFLNADSTDEYHFTARTSEQRRFHTSGVPVTADSESKEFLKTAHEIGVRISEQAVWHEGRCTWLGAGSPVHRLSSRPSVMAYKTLGPEIYSGASGVAMFLAELFAVTTDAELRHTAIGAIRQALAKIEAVPPAIRLGLYSGWSGIAFAAARVGAILREEELVSHARELLLRCIREHNTDCELDLTTGIAGAIVVLLSLKATLQEAVLLDAAIQLADELLQKADKKRIGFSWKSLAASKGRNLTGFSHGSAGVGYALLELFHATGDVQYRTAAEQAFGYERHWFDSDRRNWPDLREVSARGAVQGSVPCSTTWCHGAPGIAMSRLRAYEILKDKPCKTEASIALQTTRSIIETWLHSGTSNYSLCHGLAGNADVLLYGYQVLGRECANDLALARRVGHVGIKMCAESGHRWPSGAGRGDTPSLMLGLAGIGHFYLRLHDMATPSILILRRESYLA